MKIMALFWKVAVLTLLFSSLLQAAPLATRGQNKLQQADVNNMIRAGEQIAGHNFTAQEKLRLKQWAIELFNKEPQIQGVTKAFTLYSKYLNLSHKHQQRDMKAMIWHHFYRHMTFNWRFPKYRPSQATLYDVIQRYNPIVKRLNKERMILTKNDIVLLRSGNYFYSRPMWSALNTVAVLLAGKPISHQDSQAMHQWSLQDFKAKPQQAMMAYALFLDEMVPFAMNPSNAKTRAQYRANTYRRFYQGFKNDPLAQRSNSDLMDIVNKYNHRLLTEMKQNKQPSAIEEQILAGALIQQLKLNQLHFNNAMQSYRAFGDSLSRSIRDTSTRHSIQIGGGKIITSYPDYFVVENARGDRYNVSR
ncbi:hypothetical protein [Leucothrix pacifica]|uniref:DUF547 domain-containing protein n=1 Tax=Leucothrix pacifica TaxID=1247513 RepID=A0A317C3G8_9GAMM|nr:hypothetical protein [Leucothrix pacifica]PWQ92711.1 hypothetical protein DKW60_19935 [Leucothrix pacifica]